MSPSSYSHLVYVERPKGLINSNTFRVEEVPFDLKPAADEVVIKIVWLSIDPAMRIWLSDDAGPFRPLQIGETMGGIGVGTVVGAGEDSGFAVGNHVSGYVGTTEYSKMKAKELTKVDVPEGAQLLDFLGPLGHPGQTAFIGIIDLAKVKAGETVVVSGAAGAIGSLVCQLAKDKGAKVYGIAGSAEKCRYLEEELGIAKALNYKAATFQEDFVREVGAFDVYFDNVGGGMLDFLLTRMNLHARVILCGAMSTYASEPVPLKNHRDIFYKRATMQGFSLIDQGDRMPDAMKYLGDRVAQGVLKSTYHILEGIKETPMAINMLFAGENNGKLVIKVSRD
ncbi:uncharacterized protein C8Q71DRAFT_854746 [Rhodofomes roseus]|uniref:Enoyl reductase (ER) domain-containing protein n=1 Tax=Rhodofomes roseus TaxID=34475 RepID=A0ABQ8KQJ1_9APHY|nr:uncharacterized protein C8Q71DRAFT_854746 [Rhodofomes roseus]KAH9840892.1 hypothetical protein C8Q71DRAFT_854746 [Rhodofomes roseus]